MRLVRTVEWGRGLLLALLTGCAATAFAQVDQDIYTDSLQNGWQDWGWATIDYNHGVTVHSGSKSISVDTVDYQAIYFGRSAMNASPYSDLNFWIHGGPSGGQSLGVQAVLGGAPQPKVDLPSLAAGTWQEITLSLADLGVAGAPDLTGFWIQSGSGSSQPTFYVDTIKLLADTTPPDTNDTVQITVDALQDRRPINPMIYGVAFASAAQLEELNAPLNRSGGNATTRYNWQLNASNRANDWYFQSLSDGSATPGAGGDAHVQASQAGGAEAILTVPMIGWMPKLGPSRGKLASYSIAKYGPQTDNDWQWMPDAGNGISVTGNTPITWNDPNDANFPADETFQQGWIEHLTNTWGVSTNGGVRYYCMDNEHVLWHSTHRDVYPVGATMRDIRDRIIAYGEMVKDVDPGARLLAPEEWGWNGYFYSGYDSWWASQNGWNPAAFPDRASVGGMDYMPWLLDQLRQYEGTSGRRLLDVFTLHIYPQRGEFGNDVSPAMQLRRNETTRILWDPSYVDASWINSVIKLIPRMQAWVDTYYPGTPIGITEYNWGAENHINGATTQADIYGIFGREGLDYGTRWTTPAAGTPTFNAMKMYRNYDGNDSTFGDTSVSAAGGDPDEVSSFAAVRSADGALTVMAINKQLSFDAPVTITLTNFPHGGTAEPWQLTAANVITRLSDVPLSNGVLNATLPAQSITLFVVPAVVQDARLRDPSVPSGSDFAFWLDAQAGQRYAIQATSNFVGWTPIQTNELAADSEHITVPHLGPVSGYRSEWLP